MRSSWLKTKFGLLQRRDMKVSCPVTQNAYNVSTRGFWSIRNDSVIVWPGASFSGFLPNTAPQVLTQKHTPNCYLLAFSVTQRCRTPSQNVWTLKVKRWSWQSSIVILAFFVATCFLFTRLFCWISALITQHAALHCENGTCKGVGRYVPNTWHCRWNSSWQISW